jgi:hypothetical protein
MAGQAITVDDGTSAMPVETEDRAHSSRDNRLKPADGQLAFEIP